ncbi:MAG: serine/threonine protein kinase [Pseudomonadota bacterium]
MIKKLLFRTILLLLVLLALTVAALQILAIRSINGTLEEPPLLSGVPDLRYVTDEDRSGPPRPVIFVGNNWQGTITVIDAETYEVTGIINGIPDATLRLGEIREDLVQRVLFYGIKQLVGEGHNQYVDDMYSTLDGRRLIVSRPSFADVVAINIDTGDIDWRFEVAGFRADHMALSPDGRHVAVSASTGNVVHIIDVDTGQEFGQFPTGDSPHENVFSHDGSRIYHASIGRVFSPFDDPGGGKMKGQRLFQTVDARTMAILDRFDIRDKLDAFGRPDISPAIRPMAHTSDERTFYFQLSFLHGFVEYDMQAGKITRLADLPKVTTEERTGYVNDSAHHGIAISGDDRTLCVAGTMDDYVAIVDTATFDYQIMEGLGEKPYWVVTGGNGEHCYVSWSGTDQMSVIRYADATEITRVDVGDHPQRIREGFVTSAWFAGADTTF